MSTDLFPIHCAQMMDARLLRLRDDRNAARQSGCAKTVAALDVSIAYLRAAKGNNNGGPFVAPVQS